LALCRFRLELGIGKFRGALRSKAVNHNGDRERDHAYNQICRRQGDENSTKP